MSGYITFDVETTINSSFKRKGNPFDERNWVVYVGHKVQGQEVVTTRYLHPDANQGWLAKLLEHKPKLLVGFNIKFDILHAIVRDEVNRKAYMQWVAAGGNVWDCQLAEYLLNGMLPEHHMLSLDETAPRYGGDVKVDEVKAMWEAGIDTPDIPEDLLTRYLIGDVTNTEKIFLGQLQRARDCGQTKSILLNNGSLLYTIEAERNGMAIDSELGLALAKELEDERTELDQRLQGYLPADLPFDFGWSNRYHLSPLIFGGRIKYEVREYDLLDGTTTTTPPDAGDPAVYAYSSMDEVHYVLENGGTYNKAYYDLELAAGTPDLPEIVFIQSGKNEGQAKTKKVKVPNREKPKSRMAEKFFEFPGVTEPYKGWASSTPGLYSVAGEVIEALGERNIPFLKDLGRRAKVNKDLTTYFITTDPKTGESKGMLTLVQPDGIIHHSLNHTSTVTGRFSSSNPNLQNIPKGGKSKVKRVFRSRFKDGVIIQSDFTSLEIYIQAVLTKDKQLIADLIAGLDMHVKRVAQTAGIEYVEALRLCKTMVMTPEGEVPEFPEWVDRRTKAKVFSFQRAYGAGAAKIAATTGMTEEEVKELIAAEQAMYPEIEPWYAMLMASVDASKRGVRKTIPHPDFPAKQVELRTGYYRTPDNKLYAWIEQPSPRFVVEREGKWTGFSPTEIKNYCVQGGGGEWAKAAMWLAVRGYYHHGNFDDKALLVNQVHDACYSDADPSVKLQAAGLLHAAMELASQFMETYFGWPQPVHVPSETKWGPSMMDEISIDGLDASADSFKPLLLSFIK